MGPWEMKRNTHSINVNGQAPAAVILRRENKAAPNSKYGTTHCTTSHKRIPAIESPGKKRNGRPHKPCRPGVR